MKRIETATGRPDIKSKYNSLLSNVSAVIKNAGIVVNSASQTEIGYVVDADLFCSLKKAVDNLRRGF